MSAFTDRLYAQWQAQNGGMGAIAPMATQKPWLRPAGRVPSPLPAQVYPARPEKHSEGDKSRNSVTNSVDTGAAGLHTAVGNGKDFQ